jgi:signal recognition particle receptor subunit beta
MANYKRNVSLPGHTVAFWVVIRIYVKETLRAIFLLQSKLRNSAPNTLVKLKVPDWLD